MGMAVVRAWMVAKAAFDASAPMEAPPRKLRARYTMLAEGTSDDAGIVHNDPWVEVPAGSVGAGSASTESVSASGEADIDPNDPWAAAAESVGVRSVKRCCKPSKAAKANREDDPWACAPEGNGDDPWA